MPEPPKKRLKHPLQFIADRHPVAVLLDVAKKNASLLTAVQGALPPPYREHCLHAALDNRVLTLVCESPVWAARMRFFAPEIEARLGSKFGRIDGHRVRIQPAEAPRTAARGGYRLSAEALRDLSEAAEAMSDESVRNALSRLVRTATERLAAEDDHQPKGKPR